MATGRDALVSSCSIKRGDRRMSFRPMSRSQLTGEILMITLTTIAYDERVRWVTGVTAIALVIAHRRCQVRHLVAAAVSVVEDRCDVLIDAHEEPHWHRQSSE